MAFVYVLCLGNTRLHLPVFTKMISSWVRNVVGNAKAHVSPGSL